MAPLKSDRTTVKSYSEKIFQSPEKVFIGLTRYERHQSQPDAPILYRLSTSQKDFRPNYPVSLHRSHHKASVARFLNWFAYSRKYCLDNESLKYCPLANCPGEFESEKEMMNHLYDCPQLQNGSYECSNCQKQVKIRRFHGNTCPETHSCKERIVSAIGPLTRLLSPRPSKRQQTEKNSWNRTENEQLTPPFSPQSPYTNSMQPTIQHKWYSGDDLTFIPPKSTTERDELVVENLQFFGPHDTSGSSELASEPLLELGDTSPPCELYDHSMDRERSRLFELHGTPFELTYNHSNHQTKAHHSEPIYTSSYSQVSPGLSPSSMRGYKSDESIFDVQKATVGMTFIGHHSPHEATHAQFTGKVHENIGGLSPRSYSHGRSESASSTESYSSSGTMTTGSSDMSSSLATTPSSISPDPVGIMSFHQSGLSFDEDASSHLQLNSWLDVEPSDDPWGAKMSVSQASIYEQSGLVQMTPVCASDLTALFKTVSPAQLNLSFQNEEAYGHFPQPLNQLSFIRPEAHRAIPSIPILMDVDKNIPRLFKPGNPYTCVCGSEFQGKKPNKKSNLKRHQDTCPAFLNNQSPPKKFLCNFPGCGKGYTRPDNLLVHKRAKKHMSEVLYGVRNLNSEDSNDISFSEASFNEKLQCDESFESNCDNREYWI